MEEHWKPVVGFEGLYDVSSQGNVRTYWKLIDRPSRFQFSKMWVIFETPSYQKTMELPDGYVYSKLRGRNGKLRLMAVHRMVLDAFVGEKKKGQVCRHKDDITYHNTIDNLLWGTPKENAEDRVNHGRQKNHVVSDRDMIFLRHKHKHGRPLVNLAFDYGITFREAKRISDGKTKVFRGTSA